MTFSPIASSYTPLTIPDARFIFDANYINGLEAVNPPNNAAIAQWNDLSGKKNHVTQASGAIQPTFNTNIFGNHPGVSFTNAGQQVMAVTGNSSLNPTNCTLFAVVNFTVLTAASGGIFGKQAFGGISNNVYGLYYSTSTLWGIFINSTPTEAYASRSLTANIPIAISQFWDGTTISLNANGSVGTTALSTPPLYNTSASELVVGQQKKIATRTMDGAIGFMAMYGRQLTTDELLQMRQFLANNFGAIT